MDFLLILAAIFVLGFALGRLWQRDVIRELRDEIEDLRDELAEHEPDND